jgi:hypothetical protein
MPFARRSRTMPQKHAASLHFERLLPPQTSPHCGMANESQSSGNSDPNENIEIPPISKRNAGAATGAVIGAVGGPIGALLGGVVGAVMGKAAASNKPILPAVRRGAKKVQQTAVKSVSQVKSAAKAVRSTVKAVKRAKPSGVKGKSTARKSSGKKAPAKKTAGKKSSAKKSKAPGRSAKKSAARKSIRTSSPGGRRNARGAAKAGARADRGRRKYFCETRLREFAGSVVGPNFQTTRKETGQRFDCFSSDAFVRERGLILARKVLSDRPRPDTLGALPRISFLKAE